MAFESKAIKSDASTTIATIAVDTVSGVDYPVSQLIVGADGGSKSLVTGSTGLPVDLVAGSALTSLQLIDDVVYADDADWSDGSSKHALVGGLYQSSPQSITDGDVGPVQVTANGYLIAALSPTDNAVLDTIDAVLDTIKTDTASSLTALQLIDDPVYTDGSGTPSKGILMMGSDTSNPQALLCTSAGIQMNTLTDLTASTTPIHVDDAASGGPGAMSTMLAGLVFDDGSPDSIDEGDSGYQRMSANRNAYVTVRDAAGNERGLNIDASGNLTANLSSTDNAVLDVIAEAVHAEDEPASGGHKGMLAMVQRKDAPSANTGTSQDADYTFLRVGNRGALWVQDIRTQSEVKCAVIVEASSGDNTIVAGVTDKKIRVLSYTLVSSGTVPLGLRAVHLERPRLVK